MPKTPPRYAFPLHELARRAGVTPDTFRNHRRAGAPVPPSKAAGVDKWLAAYEAWRASNVRHAPPIGGGDNRSTDEVTWATKSTQALALTRLFDLQVKRGQYVLREEVDDQRARQVQAVRSQLDAIARRVAPLFLQAESADWIYQQLTAEFRRMYEAFANDDSDDTTSDDDEATADVDTPTA